MNTANYKIILSNIRHINKFNTEQRDYKVLFNEIPSDYIGSIEFLNNIISEILTKIKANTQNDDRIKIFINHPELTHPIGLPFLLVEDLTADMLVKHIAKVLIKI